MDTRTLIIIVGVIAAMALIARLMIVRRLLALGVHAVTGRPIAAEQVLPRELLVLGSRHDELTALGFEGPSYFRCNGMLAAGRMMITFALYKHRESPVLATVMLSQNPTFECVTEVAFDTPLVDGRITTGVDTLSELGLPSMYDTESVPAGGPAAPIYQRHLERLRALPPEKISRVDVLEDFERHFAPELAKYRAMLRERGFTRASPDPDVDGLTLSFAWKAASRAVGMLKRHRAEQRVVPTSEPTGEQRARRVSADMVFHQTLRESESGSVQNPGPIRILMLLTLVLSFVGFGFLWSWQVAAILIGVLAFHELGHAIAMRLTGHKDVNIFFIPFLGAVTTGENNLVSPMQRVAVLLAGPVPGLLAACLLLWLVPIKDMSGFMYGTLLALVLINALNLLPFSPLDGGRVFEALLPPLSAARQWVSALGFIGIGALAMVLEDPVLFIIGGFLLYSFLMRHKSMKLVREVMSRLGANETPERVAQVTADVMTDPRYKAWPMPVRHAQMTQMTQIYAQVPATRGERLTGILAYGAAWIPAVILLQLWFG